MEQVFLWLLAFIPLAAITAAVHGSPVLIFFFSGLAIIPLARFIGEATEELALRTSASWGGLLNVTFGNAPELIIGIFALRAGLIEIVKASIAGSIISNLLLVLGSAMLLGGAKYKKQEFNQTAALAAGSALFLAVAALLMPAILPVTAPSISDASLNLLSLLVAGCLLIVYFALLFFSLHTHKYLYIPKGGTEKPNKHTWSIEKSIFILGLATGGVVWMSQILVAMIEPVAHGLGWTDLFIGVVLVAIMSNAAEHSSAILMALRNKMTLSIEIAVGSATQVAMFIAPAFVVVSLILHKPMNLIFNSFELLSIFLSVIIVNIIIEDGESNWFEGFQLVMAYVIVAIAFFLHP